MKFYFDINAHLYLHDYGTIDQKLDQILSNQESLMAKFSDVASLIAGLNDVTTALSLRIDAALAQLAEAGTDAEREAAVADLTRISQQLDAMGRDPNNPLPPVE
jgi:hypothetical protein